MFGPIATKSFSHWITLLGGIASFGVPLQVGLYGGFWAGVLALLVYNMIAFFGGKMLKRLGALPSVFWLAIPCTPIGVFLLITDYRIF
jgi:hypothetical protein